MSEGVTDLTIVEDASDHLRPSTGQGIGTRCGLTTAGGEGVPFMFPDRVGLLSFVVIVDPIHGQEAQRTDHGVTADNRFIRRDGVLRDRPGRILDEPVYW